MSEPEHPGIVLWRMMRERGWNEEQLAATAGMRAATIRAIIGFDKPLTLYLAAKLGHALGTSAEYWLRMQQAWDEGQP